MDKVTASISTVMPYPRCAGAVVCSRACLRACAVIAAPPRGGHPANKACTPSSYTCPRRIATPLSPRLPPPVHHPRTGLS